MLAGILELSSLVLAHLHFLNEDKPSMQCHELEYR